MITDVSVFVGPYPFRHIARHDVGTLVESLDRHGIDRAWVGHLPSFLYRDPGQGTEELRRLLEGYEERLRPIPTIHPGLPAWEDDVALARAVGAPAVRVYPNYQQLDPAGTAMRACASLAGEHALPIVLTVKFEDVRQRHPLDAVGDLPAAAVRALARVGPHVRLLVTHADRAFVEEVHFGLTPEEARRVLWDVSCIWGPPSDDLGLLVKTIGAERFAFGTGMPLRLGESTRAKLDLSGLSDDDRALIEQGSLDRWLKDSDDAR